MADCKFPCGSSGASPKETVCIETQRILDSCRDRDCYENVRVLITGFGNDIIEHTGSVRTRSADIVWTSIGVDPIQFNRGFYSVSVKYFIKLCFEACVGGGRAQEFDGMVIVEKRVILFGGEQSAKVFRSDPENSGYCAEPVLGCSPASLPTAVVEVVDPVVLNSRVLEERDYPCSCCCCASDIPQAVAASMNGNLRDDGDRYLAVSLGLFSVIRLVRPAQLIVNAAEYSVPDKECHEAKESNPCSTFKKMPFPIGDFGIQSSACPQERNDRRCGS